MTKHALLIVGSRTAENRYGVISGQRVATALSSRGWSISTIHATDGHDILRHLLTQPTDVVVPVGFGAPTETGDIAAISRLVGVPCAGPSPSVGNLIQDKEAFSRLVATMFLPETMVRSPVGFSINPDTTGEEMRSQIARLSPPFLIKPNFSGSSEGLLITSLMSEALQLAKSLLAHEGKVLIQELEQEIRNEISITMLDAEVGPILLPIVELRRDDVAIMGVEEKFGSDSLGRHIIPARLDPASIQRIEQAAIAIRQKIGPVGLSRIDALVLASGEIVILEMNGIAGLLPTSIACDAARAAGMDFADLAEGYLATAYVNRPEPCNNGLAG